MKGKQAPLCTVCVGYNCPTVPLLYYIFFSHNKILSCLSNDCEMKHERGGQASQAVVPSDSPSESVGQFSFQLLKIALFQDLRTFPPFPQR